MADTVNRIVPLAGTIDRAGAGGQERKRNSERDEQRKSSQAKPAQPKIECPEQAAEPEKDKTKGNNIDITA